MGREAQEGCMEARALELAEPKVLTEPGGEVLRALGAEVVELKAANIHTGRTNVMGR